jgi:hypothetical protein
MSLINEALKKAQKQRTGENPSLSSMPSIGGEKAAQIARRRAPTDFNTILLRLGVGAIVLVAIVVGAVVIFRTEQTDAPPATVATAPVTAVQPTTTPPEPAPAAPSTPATSSFTAPTPEPTTIAPPSPAPATVAQVSTPTIEPPKPEPVRPAAPAKLEPRAINYIEGIRVAGIRASATDSKVLMNDRVYRLGDMVEHELGLRLVEITPHSLTFEDDRGARYTRSF